MIRLLLVATLALFAASACTTVNVTPEGKSEGKATTSAAQASAKTDSVEQKPFKPWKEATKDTRAVDGLIKFHLKRDRTLFAELRPDQLERDYGLFLQFSRGVGDYGLYDGLLLSETRLVRFRRVGDQIHLVHINPRFVADAGSPMRRSLEENVGHSIIGSFKIESEHEESKSLLVDMTGFFVSDYADIADGLKSLFENKPLSFEKDKSYVEKIQGFPKNVEIDAAITFKAPDRSPLGTDAVSDYRSIPVGVRYSLLALPEAPMQPRLADDRVGHFVDAVMDFSRDRLPDPYLRYVNRWRLEKKDPQAERSEPVAPIVFYIDHSVPVAYRPYVKEGIEAWNKAFEAAGFERAIVAKEAPEDSTWSAEDARYSTVRWTAAYRMGFAIGPSQTDPRTGEILNADILVSSEFTRGWQNQYEVLADPEALRQQLGGYPAEFAGLPAGMKHRLCTAGMGLTHQLGFQHAVLAGLGVLEGGTPMPESFLGEGIRWLVMHEVGHTLGLRHNFKSSSGIPNERLNDKDYTRQHGIYLSVMDYPPVNIALEPEQQGHYWNPEVGSYDVWAVTYAYTPISESGKPAKTPEAELPGLRKIAAKAADPLHAYNTDEDNWLGPYAVDPLTNPGDLGSDPLQYARDRAALVRSVQPSLEARLITDGEGYQRLREAVSNLLFQRINALMPVTKTVGGLYFARDHKGDPNGRTPFTPVPAERQREAVQLIAGEAFAPQAFQLDPELLNKLAPNRHSHWGVGWGGIPVDYPIHDYAGILQEVLLDELLHPARLQRMLDNEVRMPRDSEPYRMSELLGTLTGSIWEELGTSGTRPQAINSFRRNLQRTYTDKVIQLLLDAPPSFAFGPSGRMQVPVPEHARSLARMELHRLSDHIREILDAEATMDLDIRAHLTESKARIDRALETSLSRSIE